MPTELPPFNLATAALVIFALCAGFVMIRGIWRMLLGTLVLAASAGAAFYVWQHGPEWSLAVLGKTSGFITMALPVIVFLAAMVVIRTILKFVASPFTGGGDQAPKSFTNLPLRLVFALIPAGLLWLIGATLVHHAGSIAEIRGAADPAAPVSATSAFLQRMKTAVENALPAGWLAVLDPLTEPTRVALAKLIATQSAPEYEPVIDPATGKPIPRAVLVEDPALDSLAKDQDFATLLRHPNLTKILNDPKVQGLLNPVTNN
jgi:hypothetical protein